MSKQKVCRHCVHRPIKSGSCAKRRENRTDEWNVYGQREISGRRMNRLK